MTEKRQLRLGAFFSGTGSNMASWRHPDAAPDGPISLPYYRDLTRRAEAAKLDFVFSATASISAKSPIPSFSTALSR